MNQIKLWTIFDAYFSKSIKDRDVKFRHNHHSRLHFVLLKFEINISDSRKLCAFWRRIQIPMIGKRERRLMAQYDWPMTVFKLLPQRYIYFIMFYKEYIVILLYFTTVILQLSFVHIQYVYIHCIQIRAYSFNYYRFKSSIVSITFSNVSNHLWSVKHDNYIHSKGYIFKTVYIYTNLVYLYLSACFNPED